MPRAHSIANPEYQSDLVDRNVMIVRPPGNRAVLVKPCSGKGVAAWFPLSQVEIAANTDGSYALTGPEWLFASKGWL